MERDIVIPVAHEPNNDELRYCLRSLKNLPHRRVVIAGYLHTWINPDKVLHIPTNQTTLRTRFLRSGHNIRTAFADKRLTSEIILFNDDFYCIKPVKELPIHHRGTFDDLLNGEYKTLNSSWVRMLRRTNSILKAYYQSTYCYELHMPMAINRKIYLEIYKKYNKRTAHMHGSTRSLYANMMQLGGTQIPDVKVYKPESPIPDTGFISSAPGSWQPGSLQRYVKNLFKEKSQYEL